MSSFNCTIVLPAYNEAPVIGQVVASLVDYYKVIVVDNNSQDETGKVASEAGAYVVCERRQGKGNAVKRGFEEVATDYVIMADADGTYPIIEVAPLMVRLLEEYDVVVGVRDFKALGSMPRLNRLGNWVLSKVASILYGYKIRDLCSGLWGFKHWVVDAIEWNLTSEGFTLEADLFINVARRKVKMVQIGIDYDQRGGGTKPKLRPMVGLSIFWFLVRNKFTQGKGQDGT